MTRRGHRGGIRTPYAEQRTLAEQIVGKNSHRDYEKDETINLLHPETIQRLVEQQLGTCDPRIAYKYTQAEVRVDSRGQGTFQLEPKHKGNRWK